MAKKQRSTKKTTATASRESTKRGSFVKVENVHISREVPAATVSFKERKPGSYRCKLRGHPAIFVKAEEDGQAIAHIRGENPVAARTVDKAFARAVKQYWA